MEQPYDIALIVYQKDGKDYLLLANSSRGVMKIPTAQFAAAPAITARIGGTQGQFETVANFTGVEQLDLLDSGRSLVIARGPDGARNLSAVILP